MSGIRNERFSRTIRPRNPWPRGQVPDPRPGLAVDPGGDEAFHDAVGVDDAEGRVLRPDERTDLVDDDLQDVLDRRAAPAIARVAVSNAPTTPPVVGISRIPLTRVTVAECLGPAVDPQGRSARGYGPLGPWPGGDRSARLWQWKQRANPAGTTDPAGGRPGRVLAERRSRGDPARRSRSGAALIVLSVVEPHNLHLPGGLRRRVDQERDRLASGALDDRPRARANRACRRPS